MELIGLIILAIICFTGFGIFGHLISIIGTIIEWLFEGLMHSIGCLIWFVLIVLVLLSLAN